MVTVVCIYIGCDDNNVASIMTVMLMYGDFVLYNYND